MARVAVFAPAEDTMRWVTEELDGLACTIDPLPDVGGLLRILDGTASPPDVIVIDCAALTSSDVTKVQTRARTHWTGVAYGLGDIAELRDFFATGGVFERPLGSEVLRTALTGSFVTETTTARG